MTAKANQQRFPQIIAILDSDAATSTMTAQALKASGAKTCDVYKTGEEGFTALVKKPYEAAVIDWKLAGSTSGLAVLSRLRRRHQSVYLPVVFTAGQISQEDLNMLQDFPCTISLLKPIRQPVLQTSFAKLTAEKQWYLASEQQIEFAFNASQFNPEKSLNTIQSILRKSPHRTPISLIAAEHFMSLKLYKEASVLYDQILSEDSTCLRALSSKARLLSALGKHKNAMALLQKAQFIAPKSIDRLALMGDIEISLKNPTAAIEYFQKALNLDAKDHRAKIGKVVSLGLTSMIGRLISSNCEPSIAKIINNLGVQFAANKDYEKALKYYLVSFSYLANEDLRSKVSFNMGIGFKKWSKASQAKYWLEQALMLSGGKYKKAERHLSGMESVVAVAGLPTEAPPEPVAPMVDNSLDEISLMPLMIPSSPTANISGGSPKKERPSETSAPASSILDEESVDPEYLTPQKSPEMLAIFNTMITEIDKSFDELDAFVSFDEVA